jgi:DNA-binding NarL/FixJ family response regulator
MFEAFGTEAFAARAARELAATGERVRKQTPSNVDPLTPQETQIAKLAAEGYTNREIGGQLFISHRTVGYHLAKVFTKLDIKNRAQLHGAFDGAASTALRD